MAEAAKAGSPAAPVAQASKGFTIESHESLPAELQNKPKRGGRGGSSQYPFDKLQVNQSFFVPVDPSKDKGGSADTHKRLQSSISAARTRLNYDHNHMVERDVKIRGGKGATEKRPMPTELPKDKQRDFRAREEVAKDGTKGVRVYRIV